MKYYLLLTILFFLVACGDGSPGSPANTSNTDSTTGRNDSQSQVDGTAEIIQIEVVADNLIFSTVENTFIADMNGNSSVVLPSSGSLIGVGTQFIADSQFYDIDGTASGRINISRISVDGRDEIYYVDPETDQIFRIDGDVSSPINISVPLELEGEELTSALQVEQFKLIGVNRNDTINTYIFYDDNLVYSQDHLFIEEPVITDDQQRLFFRSSHAGYMLDLRLQDLIAFDIPLASNFFRLNGHIYFSANANEHHRYHVSTGTFEVADLFPKELGVVHDSEYYQGVEYLATSTGIWTYTVETSTFERIK